MLPVLLRRAEGLLAFGRFNRHPFTLRFGEHVFVKASEREGAAAIIQDCCHRTDQPVFENPHAPNTALIEVGPVAHQGLHIDGERHLLEERQQDPLEVVAVLFLLYLVPREMDVQTASGGLTTQVAESQEVIGPKQNMQHLSHIRHGLDPVQLV
jgi:hypothetical protein